MSAWFFYVSEGLCASSFCICSNPKLEGHIEIDLVSPGVLENEDSNTNIFIMHILVLSRFNIAKCYDS